MPKGPQTAGHIQDDGYQQSDQHVGWHTGQPRKPWYSIPDEQSLISLSSSVRLIGLCLTPLTLSPTISTLPLNQKWLRKSEQGDKWNRCLIEGMIVLSETGARDEQTTPP